MSAFLLEADIPPCLNEVGFGPSPDIGYCRFSAGTDRQAPTGAVLATTATSLQRTPTASPHAHDRAALLRVASAPTVAVRTVRIRCWPVFWCGAGFALGSACGPWPR